jgi:callose synthase
MGAASQDHFLEEALKVRNLLEEFDCKDHGLRRPTILGVREHVFTGSVSSLAWFMSMQESSFVTLGQRVLARPLKVRMHYGHPDVFDRVFHITRGGISKASRVINLSEDIFAGFNSTLRQGNITHHEYIQVGKGRDVGLNQIALFEAKVASGNGEQLLSRDVYRLGQLFDFFRMLSFFFTSVGFYVTTMVSFHIV